MKKTEAIEYIEAAGHSTETAKSMLKDLPDTFSIGHDGISNDIYGIIIDGMIWKRWHI